MNTRWNLDKNKITWNVTDEHTDRIEFAGRKVAVIIKYGINEKKELVLNKNVFYPELRTIPNDTHATLEIEYTTKSMLHFTIDNKATAEYPCDFSIDGILKSYTNDEDKKVRITRSMFPSINERAYIEHVTVMNISDKNVDVASDNYCEVDYSRGTKGVYVMEIKSSGDAATLKPGEYTSFDTVYTGRILNEILPKIDGTIELKKRVEYVEDMFNKSLVLETSNQEMNCEFNYSKLRITESIFDTLSGPMHGPGGGRYYAAIWTNDEIEYAAPFFGYIDDPYAEESVKVSFDLYEKFMDPRMNFIPASIIAEGLDIWQAAGDLGDAAMYIYGASRYLLQKGDKALAERYFSSLDWCVSFCKTKVNEHGVISSDADELENRLESGTANLLTSSLTYGGLVCSSYVARELGFIEKANEYKKFADDLRAAIEKYFGATLFGYNTYRYYEGNTTLRAYICAPLTVGIYERREDTASAVLNELWTENGLLSEQGFETFWDRSTLYALRGIFSAGLCERGYKFLRDYTTKRLRGDHVPYPIEAWPEGDQRHLSAEGGLYCRVIIEGMFGINPNGFSSFTISPSVPLELGIITLKKIKAFGNCFDVSVERIENKYNITVITLDGCVQNFNVEHGKSVIVNI